MLYNKSFTTYRRGLADGKRGYASTSTITNGAGAFASAQAETKAVLAIALGVNAWDLLTEESDFEESDKVVIDSENYYIESLEKADLNGVVLTHLVLIKRNNNGG